ncbi:MAG: response regulator [Rhodoferax sp.]|nr:response regulator [Rhodoferax sp.]
MRKIATNNDLMTTREAGETLGVAVRTIQLWVESGVLPAWRTAGGHRRIARASVEKLMAERTQMLSPVQSTSQKNGLLPAPVKLLVVEDDPDLLRLFAMVVEGWTFPVQLTQASNGFDGLLAIGQLHPDMVVTDLNMPGMDGFQMLRSLKKPGSGFETLAIVVVSALDPDDIKARGGLPQGVAFFQKPIDYARLEDMVRLQKSPHSKPAKNFA